MKTLLRVFLKENFSLKRLLGFDAKASKLKAVLIIFAILYAAITFFGAIGYMFFDLAKLFHNMGLETLLLNFLFTYVMGLSILFVFVRASGYLFYYKDFDLLAPLPLTPKTLFTAKLTVMMILIYLSAFLFTSPIAFSYFYWADWSLLSLLYFIIAFLTLPLIPIIVVTFVAYLIAKVTAKLRYAKLINLALMLILFIGSMVFMFAISSTGDANPLLGQQDFMSNIERYYPPLQWFVSAVHGQSALSLMWLILFNVIPFVLFIICAPSIVHKLNQAGIRSTTHSLKKHVVFKHRSVMHTLIIKEFKKLYNVPIYAFNAGLGPLILILLPIASVVFRSSIEEAMINLTQISMGLDMTILLIFAFSISMAYTSAISLSLEGKNFWIIKSLPLSAKTIIGSKILFNIILTVPLAIIGLLILLVTLNLSFLHVLAMMVGLTVFALLTSTLNALFNLLLPKLDFKNEVEVIKQSISALLGIFSGFIIMGLNGYVFYHALSITNFQGAVYLITLANSLLLGLTLLLLHIKVNILFSKIHG
ncbi:MAG: hypothetical protein ACOC1L_02425 [Bacillota bacterium]